MSADERKCEPGRVRVRSNVISDPHGKRYIPGDVLQAYGMSTYEVTDRQRDELMYYKPCCICKRTIIQIHDEGCDHPECRRQRIPSTREAARMRGGGGGGSAV